MFNEQLANKTRKLKETPEGVDTMCKAIEENNKELAKGIAISLIRMEKLSYYEIAEATKLKIEEVEELAKTINHSA